MSATVWNGAGKRIFLREVGTRDGLQVEEVFVGVCAHAGQD